MDFQEAENQRLWLLSGHVKKLSYCNSLITALYNKYPTFDQIETTFSPVNPDGTINHKIIDSSNIGIYPGSLSDNFNFCYGDPSDPKCAWRNPHERQVVEIMGNLLGYKNVSGYLTSGGSEANLSAIWWNKLFLRQRSRPKIAEVNAKLKELKESQGSKNYKEIYEQKQILKRLMNPILVMTKPPHSHSCVVKAAQVLELKTLYIEANEDGSMDVNSLRGRLAELKINPFLNLIVNVNFGTSIGAAFDDVFEIRKVLDEVKNEDWKYTVHMDAAFYGPTLPILQQYGENNLSLPDCGVDTCVVSLWKFLGVQVPCGVAIASRDFTDSAFDEDNFVEYVQMQDKVALVGTRSGIAAASSLNVLKSLNLHKNTETLKKVVQYCVDMASYMEQQLNKFYQPGEVTRKYLNVNFPKKDIPDKIIDKYLLQRNRVDKVQMIGLICINKQLIDEFINEISSFFDNKN